MAGWIHFVVDVVLGHLLQHVFGETAHHGFSGFTSSSNSAFLRLDAQDRIQDRLRPVHINQNHHVVLKPAHRIPNSRTSSLPTTDPAGFLGNSGSITNYDHKYEEF